MKTNLISYQLPTIGFPQSCFMVTMFFLKILILTWSRPWETKIQFKKW